ncbi:MAG TPA: cupin-like domain-containing protein [Pirellulaceae bacterium]|nr:cupin-like domain-containing protein [Pirellulaceae bacterium]
MNKVLPSVQYSSAPIDIRPSLFRENVDLRPYRLMHRLQDHPLLTLDSLVELAKRLPLDQREYVFAKQEFGTHEAGDHYAHAGSFDELSTEEMILNIEAQNRVIVLRNVESDAEYGKFVNETLGTLQEQIEAVTGPISGRESFIFISPPRAYTPFHYDPEQNLFLQVRGGKEFAVYDVLDRDVMPAVALEDYLALNKRTPCAPEYFDRYQLFDLCPGTGVYVPTTAPHWVRTLDEISISISINFRTPSSIRRDRVCRFNRMLRKCGLRPHPMSPRADSFRDRVKAGLFEIPSRLRRLIKFEKTR